jgi:hypothetical protein
VADHPFRYAPRRHSRSQSSELRGPLGCGTVT